MKRRRTTHNFHDGQLESYTIGPRNELVLKVVLDPVWNKEGPQSLIVKFGAIKNMEEVIAFFEKIEKTQKRGDFWGEIIGLVYEHKNKWILDIDPHGAVTIESQKFQEL